MADPSRQPAIPPQPTWIRLCRWLWNRLNYLWGTVIFTVVLSLFAGWLITPRETTYSNTPVGYILRHPWPYVSVGLGLLVLTGGLWLIIRRHSAPPTQKDSPRPLLPWQQQDLVQVLRQEYSRQFANYLEKDPLMKLRLHERTDAIDSSSQPVPRHTNIVHEAPLPLGTTILQAYDNAGGRLLLLGTPGAGKTILLHDLAQELLTRAEKNTKFPIAVILNLSSWSKKAPFTSRLIDQLRLKFGIRSRPDQTKKDLFTPWLIDQLHLKYHFPPGLSQTLLEQNRLLLACQCNSDEKIRCTI